MKGIVEELRKVVFGLLPDAAGGVVVVHLLAMVFGYSPHFPMFLLYLCGPGFAWLPDIKVLVERRIGRHRESLAHYPLVSMPVLAVIVFLTALFLGLPTGFFVLTGMCCVFLHYAHDVFCQPMVGDGVKLLYPFNRDWIKLLSRDDGGRFRILVRTKESKGFEGLIMEKGEVMYGLALLLTAILLVTLC